MEYIANKKLNVITITPEKMFYPEEFNIEGFLEILRYDNPETQIQIETVLEDCMDNKGMPYEKSVFYIDEKIAKYSIDISTLNSYLDDMYERLSD